MTGTSIEALRDEVCRVGWSLYARGYVHATAGNISVRTDSGFLITPTDACLGRLDPARLAEVNAEGVQSEDGRNCSRYNLFLLVSFHWLLHSIYKKQIIFCSTCCCAYFALSSFPGWWFFYEYDLYVFN